MVVGDKSTLPVLYRVDQDHSNVVVFRGADVAKAAAAGLIKGYKPAPTTAAPPTPAPYVPPTTTYAPYVPPTTTTTTTTTTPPPPPPTTTTTTTPKPTPVYKPAPVVYKPAPVVYKPAPVIYKPAPVVYKPAPVVYKPTPVAYKPAPAVYKPAPVVHKPTYAEPQYPAVDPNYNWEYAVKEDYANNDFGHKETRDHYLATGKYYVALPDGRFQTVTYTADESGYHPVVEYTGEASYPEENKYSSA